MINLIPPASKKKLHIEYWIRVISVWFTLWSGVLILGAMVLLPVYVLIGSQVSVYEESSAVASEKVAGYENVSVDLIKASEQARVALDVIETPLFSDYITLFDGLHDSDVQINTISVNRKSNTINPVVLTGMADNRHALASFRDRLLADSLVKLVDLPISNLASDKDIKFTITVTLSNNNDI